MVPIDLPLASTPSIRQEQTSRPSTVTLQAPQSPVEQPSLVPVRPNWSRRASSRVSCGSHRNSTGSPLTVAVIVVLRHQPFLARSRQSAAVRRASTPATLMRYSLVPRLSSIGLHAARLPRRACAAPASSSLLPIRVLAASSTSSGRAATAPSATRARDTAPLGVDGQCNATTHHGDIHLGAWDKAQIGVRAALGLRGQKKGSDDLTLGQASLRGASITSSTAISRRPLGPTTEAVAPAAIRAGTLSAAGEPLQR